MSMFWKALSAAAAEPMYLVLESLEEMIESACGSVLLLKLAMAVLALFAMTDLV